MLINFLGYSNKFLLNTVNSKLMNIFFNCSVENGGGWESVWRACRLRFYIYLLIIIIHLVDAFQQLHEFNQLNILRRPTKSGAQRLPGLRFGVVVGP